MIPITAIKDIVFINKKYDETNPFSAFTGYCPIPKNFLYAKRSHFAVNKWK